MKRKNVLILLLVFLLLLTPSGVLFVRALETSPFPERDTVSEVEMRFDASGWEKTRKGDSREVDLLYAIFRASKRVSRRALPSKYAAYRLTFRGGRADETLKLYFGASDLSLYILTSGKKLYRFPMPAATHRSTVLTPSAASFSLDGETVGPRYDYPESANGSTEIAVAEISLASWRVATEFDFSGGNVSVNYSLYARDGELLLETRDESKIVSENPDRVLMDVTADVGEGISVTLHYYLKVQE